MNNKNLSQTAVEQHVVCLLTLFASDSNAVEDS